MNGYGLVEPAIAIAGGVAAIAILLLAIRRGTRVETAYLDLWERALASSSLWERWLRRAPNTQILLLACGALLAGVAASGPHQRKRGVRDLLLVVDRSATMATREGSATRLDLAKEWVRDAIASQDPEDRIGLAAAGHTLEAIAAPSRDRAGLLASLAKLEIEEVGSDLAAAGAALEGFPKQTILVSDLAGKKVGLPRTHVVGSESENLGIVDLRVEDPFPDSDARVTATIRNGGHAERNAVVTVERGGEEAARGEARVAAGGETQLSIPFPRGRGGLHSVRLRPGDAFALDDEATFLLTPSATAPIILVRNDEGPSPALEALARALALELGVPLGTVASAADAPAEAVVFQEGGKLAKLPARAFLWGVECPELDRAGAIPAPEILGFDAAHPLTRGLRLERLVVKPKIALADSGEALVRGAGGPLLLAKSEGDRRVVAAAFRLADANFPVLEGAFPVFGRRAFLWLAHDARRTVPFRRTGDDPTAPLYGWPVEGPGRIGPCELPTGESSTASLLDRTTTDIAPAAGRSEGTLEEPDPRIFPLGMPCALAAALAFLIAFALELWVVFSERRRVALPREAPAL